MLAVGLAVMAAKLVEQEPRGLAHLARKGNHYGRLV